MYDVVLFGGTTEGRMLAKVLSEMRIPSFVSVATDYGVELLDCRPPVVVCAGRMNAEEIYQFLQRVSPKVILDATHPYAEIVSANIRAACNKAGRQYVRVKRKSIQMDGCIEFDSIDELTNWLNNTSGIIFSTLGLKEAKALCAVKNYRERIFLRLLPSAEGIAECVTLGYPAAHLCCMQGPFSERFNLAQFQEVNASILVTKESGQHGGFLEKVSAAKACGMLVAVLKRPSQENGLSYEETVKLVQEVCR